MSDSEILTIDDILEAVKEMKKQGWEVVKVVCGCDECKPKKRCWRIA